MAENSTAISTLNSLIETANDGAEGFKVAAEGLQDPSIKQEFQRYALERARFANELKMEVQKLGGSAETGGSVSGAMHRGWMNIKSAVTGKSDAAIIAEAERGEDVAYKEYEKALSAGLQPHVQAVVQRQYGSVKAAHDRVRELEKMHSVHK